MTLLVFLTNFAKFAKIDAIFAKIITSFNKNINRYH